MKTLIAACAAALMSVSSFAAAQEMRLPLSDFAMTVRIHDHSSGHEQEMQMRHRSGDFRMEGEFQGQSAIVLVNPVERMSTILVNMQGTRMAIEMPMGDEVSLPLADERFGDAVGNDTVAGEPCTIYRVEDEDIPGGEALGCMTDDNIVLRVDIPDRGTAFEATHFSRASQDASLFTVPAGYQRMRMPGR
ncbi:hypothetical protein [Glycocaulis sp.]|uniref:hypothetical protein n=1 Tax=Glycocaulis sp. TaxID=1969725 RepID=UPI003F718181